MLMQFQADMLNTTVVRPVITETTALGAAYLAGLAVGFWSSIESLQQQWQLQQKFVPNTTEENRTTLINGWKTAVNATLTKNG
jgi:glycerol kinase